MSRRLAVAAAGAAAVLAALPGSALASDRNHDHLPDRWERHHGLSLHHHQGGRDQDHDGLRNRAEYRHHTDPRDADSDDDGLKDGAETRHGMDPRDRDSDDDGVRDGREGAGTVKAFNGTTLTITLASGGALVGRVTATTELKCESEDDSRASVTSHGGDDGPSGSSGSSGSGSSGSSGSGSSSSGSSSDDSSSDDHGSGGHGSDDPAGDDHGSGGHGSDDAPGDDHGSHVPCGVEALVAGAVVDHAELHSSSGDAAFEEVELRS